MTILPRWLGGKKQPAPSVETAPGTSDSAVRREAQRFIELANVAEDSGDLALALTRIREAIRIDPGYARAHLNLGNVLQAGGNLEEAISATLEAIRLDEQYAEGHYNLGRLYGTSGDGESAEACYLKALEIRPQFPEAAMALAIHFEAANRIEEAQSWLRRTVAANPRHEVAIFDLCRLLLAQGKVGEAEQQLRSAVAENPQLTGAYCALGDICRADGRQTDARNWYTKALAVGDPVAAPEDKSMLARAASAVGLMLIREDRWEDATIQLRRAIELLPELVDPYINLAYMEMRKACPHAAADLYRKATAADPDALLPRSYLLFTLNMVDDIDPKEIFAEHQRFGEWLEGRTQQRFHSYANPIDPARTLRVGYMSGDFRVHPVAQFIAPLLEDHEPSLVQPFCYSNTRERDEHTDELERRFAGNWRDITRLDDDGVAALVREDEIDILVDLSGHTGNSRIAVFAQRPAPIQVTWLGYLNTTGLKSMDYRLVDHHTDPVGEADTLHTERLIRLPDSQWAYWPVFEVPIMRAQRKSDPTRVVFGSFNQFSKLSDRCLATWGQIMARVPDARLRVAGLPPGNIEEHLLRRLERVGIAGTRVEVARRMPQMQYLRAFNEIDIALDSMPYNGATTTLDTLWMGVPVVGLVGTRSISRGTYSILKTLGMDELIAQTPEQYVELNVRLAIDADWRNSLHDRLRDMLRRSPLTDVSGFTENLEAAYRGMWRDWCASQEK
jgi:predicted O-linked N-acetylglucosamine transferase (SPINDLY family)